MIYHPLTNPLFHCTYPAGNILTENKDCKAVCDALWPIKAKWRQIGVWLGLKYTDINALVHRYGRDETERCLQEMVSVWLTKYKLEPTWQTVAAVLENEIICEEELAYDIKKKYMKKEEAGGFLDPLDTRQCKLSEDESNCCVTL